MFTIFLDFFWILFELTTIVFFLCQKRLVSVFLWCFLKSSDFWPIFSFYTPWKKTKNFCFSGVFKGHKIKTLVKNGFSFLHFEDTSSSWYATFLHYMKSFSTHYLRFATKTVFSRFFFKNSLVLQRLVFGFTKVHGVNFS